MKNVRVWFEKDGSAQYISHLDLARCMGRALKLSGLPVWYTEGFNPRVYMTYAMPLSLGIRGERECMDIRLTEPVEHPEIVRRLNQRLPEDIRVLGAGEPVTRFEDIAFADYELLLESESGAALADKLRELLSRETVTVIKRGKKGEKEFDLKPFLNGAEPELLSGTQLRLLLRLPCSAAGSVNPSLLLDALRRWEGEEPWARITRKRLLTEDFSEIR